MKIADLIQILNGDIDLIDRVNVRDVALFEDRVPISPRHVKKMLINFLQAQVTASKLTKWAMFLTLRAEYVCPDPGVESPNSEFDDDYYVDMWYVIQRISTPQIDGEVNTISVSRYLQELDKYKNDKPLKIVPTFWEKGH